VIGYSFWQSEFAQDPAITSRAVRLDGHVFPIIGVTAPEFFGVEIGHRFEVAVPLCSDPMFWEHGKNRIPSRTAWWLSIMGRLKPGWSVARADAQMKATHRRHVCPPHQPKFIPKSELISPCSAPRSRTL
jgi:hypothetical protein